MSRQELLDVLSANAQQRSGEVDGIEFGVDQGPFENSNKKYVAYLTDAYDGDFFFDSVDEFLNGFMVNGQPIGNQIDSITYFDVVQFL